MEQGSNKSDREKFMKKVYDDYYQRLCFYASKYVEDMEDAKDIVQELFVRLWEGNMTFENEQALSSYLYSGVFHACLNFRKFLYQQGTVDESNYVSGRIEHEVLWEVFQAVDDLPEESRKVFKLSYMEGRGIQEVADLLHISVHTVKSQRAYAKKLLKECLKDLYPVVLLICGMLH